MSSARSRNGTFFSFLGKTFIKEGSLLFISLVLAPPPPLQLKYTKVSLGGHLSQMQREMLKGGINVEIIGKQGEGGTLFPKISQKSTFDIT